MAGKFRETVIHEVPKEKAEPQAEANPASEDIAGAEEAPKLSQDAINALNEAKAAKAKANCSLLRALARWKVEVDKAYEWVEEQTEKDV